MTSKPRMWIGSCLLLVIVSSSLLALQRGRGGRWRNPDDLMYDRGGVPTWENDPEFKNDVFTFARVQYDSHYNGDVRGGGAWWIDFPDSDLNFSLRLQQLTSIKVNPNPVVVRLTDEHLNDYPFLYMIEPGRLLFSDDEVVALRKYCLNGGFLMVDDFWGDKEYKNFRTQIERVFPDRILEDVPLEHEIFHMVYDLKERPQIPSIHSAGKIGDRLITWEDRTESDTSIVVYQAIKDEAGRIMVFVCHNTDLGDGWEREGENQWYFEEFSVKKAYPLGINIVTYAMTH